MNMKGFHQCQCHYPCWIFFRNCHKKSRRKWVAKPGRSPRRWWRSCPLETVETLAPTEPEKGTSEGAWPWEKKLLGAFEDLGCLSVPFCCCCCCCCCCCLLLLLLLLWLLHFWSLLFCAGFNLWLIFLEFTGLVRCFSAMLPCFRKKSKPEKPSRNYAGVVRDASECTIQQGKAVEGGEIQGFKAQKTEELLELKSKGEKGLRETEDYPIWRVNCNHVRYQRIHVNATVHAWVGT